MLSNFFRINLPYGIARNEKGEWMAFNREYMPLGYNNERLSGNPGKSFLDLPIYSKYKGLTEAILSELAIIPESIERNEDGEIVTIFLYNDRTNPTNQTIDSSALWNNYFEKVKRLSRLKVDRYSI